MLNSLIVGDGSGAAEIAADQVVPILGAGTNTWYSITSTGSALSGAQVNLNPDGSYSFQYYDGSGNLNLLSIADALAAGYVTATTSTITETQFQFQGAISSQKPFRDWLTEVLNCCLGFYTWEFGKLKLGCRINVGSADAYTIGNILYQSLRLTPIQAALEHLVISYADVAYQYQANTAEYCDKSHAAYYGRAGSPLTSQMHSVGLSTLSQALRVAATRTREECGGVTPAEWRNARAASWQTTLLGLGNEVGQVVSMTHPDVPGMRGTCNVSGNTATWVSGDPWTYAGTALGDTELVNKVILIGGQQVTITAVAGDGSTITTNPAPPSGAGQKFQVITMCFRVQRWSLMKDWSVRIEGQTVTQSMYDLDVGPKPTDVRPEGLPALFYAIPLGPTWEPYQLQASGADALFPSEWNFDVSQVYSLMANGTPQASLAITGKQPVNQFSPTGAGAPGIGSISQSGSGGYLPANSTLKVTVCAIDGNGIPSVPSNIAIVGTSGSGADSFTLTDITWPAVAGMTAWVLFVGTEDNLICAQAAGALTAGANNTYTPGSIAFRGPLARSTWALPSPYVSRVRVKAKIEPHAGVAGVRVDSVPDGTNSLVCSELVDTTGGGFTPVGRVVSVIGRASGSQPVANFNITGYTAGTGTLHLDRDPSGIVLSGDALVIRNKADNLIAADLVTSVNDDGYRNIDSGYVGLTAGAEVGNLIRIIAGTGRGQAPSLITANTATALTFQPPLTMASDSVWIVESPTWLTQTDSGATVNASPTTSVGLTLPVQNFAQQALLVAGFTVDVNGKESPDGDIPLRECWIVGAQGTRAISGNATMLTTDSLVAGTITSDATYTSLPSGLVPNQTFLVQNALTSTANLTIQLCPGDTFDDGTSSTVLEPGQSSYWRMHGDG